jgi:hypothetical protein
MAFKLVRTERYLCEDTHEDLMRLSNPWRMKLRNLQLEESRIMGKGP